MVDVTLKILVIDENPVRSAILEEGLRDSGYADVVRLDTTHELLRRIYQIDPDVILMDLADPSRDVLEQMFQVSRMVKRPVAMFVDQSDTAMIEASVDAGVSAYIVDGLRKERVKPILDMTVSRFNAFERLSRELDQARTELADRKLIERAKGILMKSRGVGEDEAYALLRKTAMNEKKKLAEIAQSVVTAAQLFG
ncbi:MAG: ANTAR domain-containing protein [Hyphomicrobiales bacterium]|nr:ANTAR domain-containing protein [Hyphomicrobiales bacterium]